MQICFNCKVKYKVNHPKNDKNFCPDCRLDPNNTLKKHPLSSVYQGIVCRCNCKSNSFYKNYGGRGIKLCERWKDKRYFIEDNEDAYFKAKETIEHPQIDRINNEGDYEPNNVRWVSRSENCQNRRPYEGFSSQYRGVKIKGNQYVATIKKNQKSVFLGSFNNEEDAARAYNHAAIKMFDKPALNFIKTPNP